MAAPGVSHYSGLKLASRIGPIKQFPRPRSLAIDFGPTRGCRNSGNAQDRLGSVTKEGSKIARFILGQWVLHFLKHDPQMRKPDDFEGTIRRMFVEKFSRSGWIAIRVNRFHGNSERPQRSTVVRSQSCPSSRS